MYETEYNNYYNTMNHFNFYSNKKKVKCGLTSFPKENHLYKNNNNDNQYINKKQKIKINKTKSKDKFFSTESTKLVPSSSRITINHSKNNYMTIQSGIKLFRTTTNFFTNRKIKSKNNINDIKNKDNNCKNNKEEKKINIKSEYSPENNKSIKNLEIERYIFRNKNKLKNSVNEFNLINDKKVTKKNNYITDETNNKVCNNIYKTKNSKKSIFKFKTKENNNKKYYNNQLPLLNKIKNNKKQLCLKRVLNDESNLEKNSIKRLIYKNNNCIENSNNSNKENKENNIINDNNNIISYNYKFRFNKILSSYNSKREIKNQYRNFNNKLSKQMNSTNSDFGNNKIIFNNTNSKLENVKNGNSNSFYKFCKNNKIKVKSSNNIALKTNKNNINENNENEENISKKNFLFENFTSTNFFMDNKKRISVNKFNEVKYSSNAKKEFLKLEQNLTANDNYLIPHQYNSLFTSIILSNNKKDKLEKYNIGKILGKGAYATVRLIKDKITNEKYAMKIYDKSKLNDSLKKKCVYKEIEILKRINHKNIVKLIEVIYTKEQILIIQEYIKGMSLREYYNEEIRYQKGISDHKAKIYKKIFKQIFDAMNYLHSNYMAHRDIKLENILMTKEYEIKIIDFGFGMLNPENKTQHFFCGTPNYIPPEIVDKRGYIGQKADLWSLGVLVYKIYCADFPFKGRNEKELYKAIKRSDYYIIDYVPNNVKKVIKGLIEYDPNKRLTCKEILKSEWLKN